MQTLWDYQRGGLHFSLHPARQADVGLPVAALPCEAVRVSDNGYFDVSRFEALAEQGCFQVSRVPAKVRVYDAQGRSQALADFLSRQPTPAFDGWVTLTAHGLRTRLIAQPVPLAVARLRQARLRRTAKRKHTTVSAQALALSYWTILITNLPADRLSTDQALFLFRLRWQIELLFKRWKQLSTLELSRTANPHHRPFAFLLLQSGCQRDTRRARPSHFQLLAALS